MGNLTHESCVKLNLCVVKSQKCCEENSTFTEFPTVYCAWITSNEIWHVNEFMQRRIYAEAMLINRFFYMCIQTIGLNVAKTSNLKMIEK